MTSIGRLAERLGTRLLGAWCRSLRMRALMPDGANIHPAEYVFDNEIIAICERDILALAGIAAAQPFIVLIAPGRDGDRAAAFATSMGCTVVRGSSRHPAYAAYGRLAGLGRLRLPIAIVVDGPTGPAGIAKAGAIALAAATGRPVLPVSCAARPAFRFPRTWSGIYLPLPWARVRIIVGEPWRIDGGTTRTERVARAAALSEALGHQRQRAESAAG